MVQRLEEIEKIEQDLRRERFSRPRRIEQEIKYPEQEYLFGHRKNNIHLHDEKPEVKKSPITAVGSLAYSPNYKSTGMLNSPRYSNAHTNANKLFQQHLVNVPSSQRLNLQYKINDIQPKTRNQIHIQTERQVLHTERPYFNSR